VGTESSRAVKKKRYRFSEKGTTNRYDVFWREEDLVEPLLVKTKGNEQGVGN